MSLSILVRLPEHHPALNFPEVAHSPHLIMTHHDVLLLLINQMSIVPYEEPMKNYLHREH